MAYPKDIEEYIANLFARREEGEILPRMVMEGGDWQPHQKECHNNVDAFCQYDSNYSPVRGWLFFDYAYLLGFVSFLQHSVLRFPDGDIKEITPSHASRDYPFIIANETDEEFFEKEQYTQNGNLYYQL